MIRKLLESDIDKVMSIWLNANLDAHPFIDKNYWFSNLEMVKDMIIKAEVYVYDDGDIKAFIGLDDKYIAGIFVDKSNRSIGIGKKLLDYVKESKDSLRLNVYQKNEGATNFYLKEDFKIIEEIIDSDNNELEYLMEWHNSK